MLFRSVSPECTVAENSKIRFGCSVMKAAQERNHITASFSGLHIFLCLVISEPKILLLPSLLYLL